MEEYETTGESSEGGDHDLGKVADKWSVRLLGKSQEAWRERAASRKGGSNTNAWRTYKGQEAPERAQRSEEVWQGGGGRPAAAKR